METRIDEIADDVFRLSTFVPDGNMMFNQFVVRAEEPLLFHTGMRALFPLVSEAVGRIIPIEQLRWITFGHVESDENGTMNDFLAVAPHSAVAHGAVGCMVQVNDLADRPPRPLADGEVIDLGGRRVRNIDTPHVPHSWDAHVLYEETTRTLLAGDLFTQVGDTAPISTGDILTPAFEAEAMFHATALTPATAPTIRKLAGLDVATIALMHGPAFKGDTTAALHGLADGYERMLDDTLVIA
jgi:flavorubredoxin